MKNRIIADITNLLEMEGSNHAENIEFEYKYGDIIVFVSGTLHSFFKEEIVFETKIEEVLQSWQFSNIVIEFYTNEGELQLKIDDIFKNING